ncbi:unnamed protein product, partial [Ectocarpus fasciculatus]
VKNVWIHPSSAERQLWNAWISFCLIYNGVVIPVRIAFDLEEGAGAYAFDRCIDASFILDVMVNFETGILPDNAVTDDAIMERSRVYRMYLCTWFPVDFISSIPVEVILLFGLGISSSGGEARSPKLLRSFIRLVLKSARMTRMMKSAHILESLLGLDSADLIRFIIFVLFLLHWSACIFYFLDSQLCADSEDRSTYLAHDMDMLPFMDKYVASFYWAFATVLTIGYGDISAQCTATRVFSLFTMLVGSVGYAYGISMVMGMMQKRREQNREFKELMSSVEDYAHFRHLPAALKEDVREYFTFMNARNEFINEKIILDQLTPELRKHVLHHVNSELIQSVDFFRELQIFENSLDSQPKNLLIDIIAALQTRVLRPGEVVIREGEVHDVLYLITKGQVCSYKWGRLKLDTFGDGNSFGEACFLSRSLKR